jgi:predicted nucleic acid-binding protein
VSVAYPAGTVFLDANVFLHNVFAHRLYQAYCRTLLRKVETGEIVGVTSILVLDEVLFRMLIAETARTFSIPVRQAHLFLKDHPDRIAGLKQSWADIVRINSMPHLRVLGLTPTDFQKSLALGQQHGLLPHDALHLTVMQREGISALVTTDADFDRVAGLKVFKPVPLS